MHLLSPTYDLLDQIDTVLILRWVTRIGLVTITWIIVGILVRYLTLWIRRFDERSKHLDISRRDLRTIDRLLDYIIVFVGVIITLAIMGWTSLLVSALTAAGVFTIIIGFAVKDVAANFISGIFILIDQPFAPGDFVEIGSHSGTVESVSLRSTTLVTVDGPLIYIPNSIVSTQPTTNFTLAQDRRISFTVSIANEADVNQALDIVEHILQDEEGLLQERTQLVLVDKVREYAVDIGVSCYAPKDTFFTLASDLKKQVMTALQQNGIELAVPVRKHVNPELATVQAETASEE